jgi:hypothetical protein
MNSWKCRVLLALGFAVVAQIPSSASGQMLIAVGVGTVDQWDTEFELANPFAGPLGFQIGNEINFQHSCPAACDFNYFVLPPYGSIRIRQADIFPVTNFLYTAFVLPGIEGSGALPTMRARVFNTLAPSQAVEVPVFKSETVMALASAGSLAFPSIARTATSHTNLVLANFAQADPYTVNLDLYDPTGLLLASMQLNVSGLLFLKDIVAQLGVSNLERGQSVITPAPGNAGTPTGFAAILDSNSVVISQGQNP